MLTETARVVAIEADGLWVQTVRRSICGGCAAQQGCGHGLLYRSAGGKRGRIRVLPGDGAVEHCRIDDQVLIGIPEEVIVRGSFIAYVVPLLAMLAGALATVHALPDHGDLFAAVGAIGGLLLGFVLTHLHSTWHNGDTGFQPVLLGVVSPLPEPVALL